MIERRLFCEGPDCLTKIRTATPPPYVPPGWLVVTEGRPGGSHDSHYCSWWCLGQRAKTLPPPVVKAWRPREP